MTLLEVERAADLTASSQAADLWLVQMGGGGIHITLDAQGMMHPGKEQKEAVLNYAWTPRTSAFPFFDLCLAVLLMRKLALAGINESQFPLLILHVTTNLFLRRPLQAFMLGGVESLLQGST